jgi:hypothetical protein
MPDVNFFDAAHSARGTAIACTEEHFDYCLEVLPPVYATGFYGLGEAYSHEAAGVTRHWFKRLNDGRCFCAFGTKAEAAAAFAATA